MYEKEELNAAIRPDLLPTSEKSHIVTDATKGSLPLAPTAGNGDWAHVADTGVWLRYNSSTNKWHNVDDGAVVVGG